MKRDALGNSMLRHLDLEFISWRQLPDDRAEARTLINSIEH